MVTIIADRGVRSGTQVRELLQLSGQLVTIEALPIRC